MELILTALWVWIPSFICSVYRELNTEYVSTNWVKESKRGEKRVA